MRTIIHLLLGLGLGSSAAAAGFSLPTTIYLDNHTGYTIDGYTAGQPGVGLNPHTSSVGVPYLGVITRWNMANMAKACPVEFYNRDNHDLIASVYVDIWTGTVTGQPALYGHYAQELRISGWEGTLSHITLEEK